MGFLMPFLKNTRERRARKSMTRPCRFSIRRNYRIRPCQANWPTRWRMAKIATSFRVHMVVLATIGPIQFPSMDRVENLSTYRACACAGPDRWSFPQSRQRRRHRCLWTDQRQRQVRRPPVCRHVPSPLFPPLSGRLYAGKGSCLSPRSDDEPARFPQRTLQGHQKEAKQRLGIDVADKESDCIDVPAVQEALAHLRKERPVAPVMKPLK